jgi:hypothetical protein
VDKQTEGLKWVVRALAQPAHIQIKLFPSFTFPVDEMLLEFEQHFVPEASRFPDQWSGVQYLSLLALDEKFRALSEPDHEELWSDENCLERPEWTEIRRLALEVIQAFDWPAKEPPQSRAGYFRET